MARRKVSTLLDEHLFRRAKLEAVRQGKQVSEVLGEALEQYLAKTGVPRPTMGAVADSWGALPFDRRKLKRLLADEDGLLDT